MVTRHWSHWGGQSSQDPGAGDSTLQGLPAQFPTRPVSHWTGLLGINLSHLRHLRPARDTSVLRRKPSLLARPRARAGSETWSRSRTPPDESPEMRRGLG